MLIDKYHGKVADISAIMKFHPMATNFTDWKEVTRPLHQLGINYFAYNEFNDDGSRCFIGGEPDMFEYFFRKKAAEHGLHRQEISTVEQYALMDLVTHNNKRLPSVEMLNDFGFGHVFVVARREGDIRRFYSFATTLGNEQMNNMYLWYLHEIQQFIRYFHDTVDQSDDFSRFREFIIPSIKPVNNYIDTKIADDLPTMASIPELDKERYYFSKEVYLTTREYQCLEWMARGKTMEEISLILDISERTVRFHINSIKTKTGCYTIFQLGHLYSEINRSDNIIIHND